MNHAQFALFFVYALAVWSAGVGALALLTGGTALRLNRIVYVGESLLLGSILLVGELMLLSMLGLYRPFFLWTAAAGNFLFLLNSQARRDIATLFSSGPGMGIPGFLFGVLLLVLCFRNCYFLIDVDSLSTYLYAQKLWLEAGSSLVGGPTYDLRIFNPQYDNVAYSLGLSLFGQETLFPELVNLFWRVISVILVYGYATYRLGGYYALSAAFFVVLNDHFFYSGVNRFVLLNAAVIALIFASTYNFWEARVRKSVPHLVLALIFLSQIIGNKIYTVQAVLFLLIIGLFIQENLWVKIRTIIASKRLMGALVLAAVIGVLGYVKNFIVTGDPLFPFLSGKLHLLGRTEEQQAVFLQILGGLNFTKILKYFSFLFVWPGVNPAKYILIGILTLPLIAFWALVKNARERNEDLMEVCFWLGVSLLLLIGMCLSSWQDPRPYRFPIGVFAFGAVVYLRFLFAKVFNIPSQALVAGLVLFLSLQGYQIVNNNSAALRYPTFKDNIDVLLDRVHMEDAVKRCHPDVLDIREGLRQNPDPSMAIAWRVIDNSQAFLYPYRPLISLFLSSTIKWDSYDRAEQILADLKRYGIKRVMMRDDNSGRWQSMSAEEFCPIAMQFDRRPQRTQFDYGFPSELTRLR